MELTLWVCLLSLQAGLLSHALDCSGTPPGGDCITGHVAGGLYDDIMRLRPQGETDGVPRRRPPKTRPGGGSAVASHKLDVPQKTEVLSRNRRQLERRGPTHLSHSSMPGAVSIRGFPNTLIQAERARRHLGHPGSKKKIKVQRKSRVGSFSLLKHDHASPLQVTRVRRQLQTDLRKGKSGRSGAYSVLGDPGADGQADRPKRSAQKKKKLTSRMCS